MATPPSGSLRIGDTVLFRINNGFVYSELSSSPYNFMMVSGDTEELPNVNFAVFKVLAPNKYKARHHLAELEQRKSEEYEILNAKRALEVENTENEIEQARRYGSRVLYGDSVQLQHVSSKKFVSVHSEASKTESNNLLISLSSVNAEGCVFKVLPRYKVRSEGDEVRFRDQLKIESMKTQGQFLHSSNRTLGASNASFNVLKDCFELNLSATESALTLISHFSPSSNKIDDKALRAGSCVRLFHKEDECYIVAEGSFAELDNPIIEDVHCRMRRVDNRKHGEPSTSSNTYWQIEKQENPIDGNVISWGDRCRLKHLPTRSYLAVQKEGEQDWKVTLTEEKGLDTIFSFSPLIQEGDEVLLESYALIKHRVSGRWLHLDKQSKYERVGFDSKAKGLAGLQWDSAELYKLTTSADRGDYDSFTLQEVKEDLVDRFNFVAGIVPVLTAFIRSCFDGSDIKQKQGVRVRESLKDLKKWLVTDRDRDTKNNQKLLRNLRVLEQLAEILKAVEELSSRSKHFIVEIGRECYNVIQKFLEGDSRKNENYLAHFIEFFQTQMGQGLNAEEVLVEIVQDNLTIVSTMADTQMSNMIKQFVETQDPRFLEFLSSLCVCADRPIPSTQIRLLNELVRPHGRDIFLQTEVDRIAETGEERVFVRGPSVNDKLISMRKINPPEDKKRQIRRSTSEKKDKRDPYELLLAQLHFIAKLCKGNNNETISALMYSEENSTGYIGFNEAITVVKDAQIDSTLRSCYVELILVMFVDVGENRSFLDHLCYSFVYDGLSATPYDDTGDEETIALTGVENLHFPDLKNWILDTINSRTELRSHSSFIKQNEYLSHVLELLGYLVRYGYYDDLGDVDDTMIPLIKLLDGHTDLPSLPNEDDTEEMTEFISQFRASGRKMDTPENKAVFGVKCRALEVLELFFRFKFYVKLQKFMYDFIVLQTKRIRVQSFSFHQSTEEADPPVALSQLIQLPENDCSIVHSSRMISMTRDRIKYLCGGCIDGGGFAPADKGVPKLEEVLLDLSEYDCDELVTASLDLLTQMYFFEEELFQKAHQGQLLTAPESLKDFKLVKDDILPELRQLLRVDANRENQDRVEYLMQQLKGLCIMRGSDDPNKQNQLMLDNFGLVSELVSFVLSNESQESQVETASATEDDAKDIKGAALPVGKGVCHECLCLLRHLATDNISVQKRLFNRIDDLLDITVPVPVLSDLADLITEVFTGGPELILKVTEDHIEKIFGIMKDSENCNVQAQFMVTLEAMAKIEEFNLPVARNQAQIIKNFCQLDRKGFCKIVLGEDKDIEEQRMDLLETDDDDSPQLQLLLNVTDMLAACAEGKHRFIESVCQNILSIDELINIMTSNLPPNRKRPFVRFLIWVYMVTQEDQRGQQGATLSHGDLMWGYLKHMAEFLENIATVLDGVSSEGLEDLKYEMTASNRRRTSFSSAARPKKSSRILSVKIYPGITDERGQLIPGLLEYLADGVIPLLHSYYTTFFDPDGLSKESEKSKEFEVSANIAKSLAHLSKELIKVFSSQSYIQMYQETLNKLLEFDEIKERASLDEKKTLEVQEALDSVALIKPSRHSSRRGSSKKLNQGLQKQFTVDSQIEEETSGDDMIEHYDEQQELNDLFNSYSRNYHSSYMGPNTARHQINSPVEEIEYSDEGEELPLGPSFQRLVHLFFSPQNKEVKEHSERLLYQLEVSSKRTEQLGEAEQVKQNILDVRCLQLLRALIHNQIKQIDPELKDRDPIKFREKSDTLIVPIQNRIQGFDNAVNRVIPLLTHIDESISREALALMKALLFSGNEECQDGIARSVQETREEIIFLVLKQRLEIGSLNYRETNALKAQLDERKELKRKNEPAATTKEQTLRRDTSTASMSRKVTFSKADETVIMNPTSKEVAISMETLDRDEEELSTLKRPKALSFVTDDEAGESSCSKPEGEKGKEVEVLSQQLIADGHWTNLVLEVIGLMCDGQNRTLQNYLREQPDNFKTINVVAEVTAFLHAYTADFSQGNLAQISQILQALVEMCVGNVENQQVIYDKLVLDPLNRILQLPLDEMHKDCVTDDPHKCTTCSYILELIQVKGSAIELLDVMLEEINPLTATVAKGIGSSLDVDSVFSTMKLFYDLQSHSLVRKQQMDDDCQRGLNKAYQVLVTLIDYGTIPVKSKRELKKLADKSCRDAVNAAAQHSHSIEIHYEEEGAKPMLARVHFPYKGELREEVTELVRWSINRDSMEDKQRALLDLMPALKRDVLHQTKLKDTKIMKPFLAFHSIRSRLLMFVTVLLNLFLLFIYTVPPHAVGNNTPFRPDFPRWFHPLFFVLGAIHLFLSLWIVVEYFVINWPHFRLPSFCYTLRAKLEYAVLKESSTYQPPRLNCIDVGLFSISTLYMFLFLLSSILSLAFSGYFYCFCLLFIIIDNDILKRVLRSVTKNGISLIWVAILGLIVLFIYAVISFALLQNNFDPESSLYCSNLGECTYSVLRYGLVDNLGFVVPFQNGTSFDPPLFSGRLIFGLSYFVIVSTIGLNIVFGIIVDSFSELREERSNIEAEQKSKCFICDLPSYDFERRAKGFHNHVKHDHNMWDYVYYSLYLDNIDTGDHNAIQKYVYELISENDTGFFPQEEARCLSGEVDTTGEKIGELQEKVESILQHFRDKEYAKSVKAKELDQKKWEQEVQQSSITPQISVDQSVTFRHGLPSGKSMDFGSGPF
ncbi:PREDICTED: inositol 1,4,5-trisphosphate receptor type 3-like [Amphimedon queenslandica]|uniref:MIR domain-containing protein n=1 Tax=Amphimedon queenslandica TaxID=400682 RepID=A0AAN0J5B9_AMPQE|nr:PREDICTED: inositol 1,4,5-trisphosphate receptor type 3-like [Amphimedon queenslandica]|eukprot:XP_019851941.1 PREDICTED: inositol 1,4,5-trisphosphate receptor type 3-like [Amphimedon queenslandica]